jgi:hypothetical protein
VLQVLKQTNIHLFKDNSHTSYFLVLIT